MRVAIVAIPLQQELMSAIQAHLATHGEGNWSAVREKFPSVSEATLWRYIRKVRTGDIDVPLKQARQRLTDHVAMTAQQTPGPNRTEFAGSGPGTDWQRAGVLTQIAQGFDDLELLRRYSMSADNAIKNPLIFAQGISLRDRLVGTAVKCGEAAFEAGRVAEWIDSIVDEVAAEAPETAQRITKRLHQFSTDR